MQCFHSLYRCENMLRHLECFGFVFLAALLVSCGGDSTGPDDSDGEVGPPAQVSTVSGDAQSGTVGAKLPGALVVKAVDARGKAVANASVTWAVDSGGGSLSASSVLTDAQGQAQVEWTLGTKAGENRATAKVGSLTPVTFTASAKAGDPAKAEKVKGDAQRGTAGSALADALVVKATDAHGNPLEGISVAWQVTAGGGSVGESSSSTDKNGIAQVSWTLGTKAGANTASATVSDLAAASFTATGVAGAPAKIVKVGGDDQTGSAGVQLANPLVVRLTDAHDNLTPDVSVTWAVTQGGGSVTPSPARTNDAGEASTSWTLGSAGKNEATASVDGVSPATFTASAAAEATEVGGIVRSSTTWTLANSPYKLVANVQIAAGATLTIEPGVVVDGEGNGIEVWGTLSAAGSEASRVSFNNTLIVPRGARSEAAQIHLDYTRFEGGSIYAPTGHAIYASLSLRNSVLNNLPRFYIWYPMSDVLIERNVFNKSGGLSVGTGTSFAPGVKVYIRNNSFYEQTTAYAVENWASYYQSETVVEKNSFWNTDRTAVRLPKGFTSARLTAKNNYWHTSDEAVIQSMIFDKNDDLGSAGYIEYKPFLTASDPDTPAR